MWDYTDFLKIVKLKTFNFLSNSNIFTFFSFKILFDIDIKRISKKFKIYSFNVLESWRLHSNYISIDKETMRIKTPFILLFITNFASCTGIQHQILTIHKWLRLEPAEMLGCTIFSIGWVLIWFWIFLQHSRCVL